jgi:cbb3-type cytochrome oxidase subunit 3
VIRLSELVSALTPSQYAELALVLFLAVFVAVALRHGGKRRAAEHAECARLPFDDGELR